MQHCTALHPHWEQCCPTVLTSLTSSTGITPPASSCYSSAPIRTQLPSTRCVGCSSPHVQYLYSERRNLPLVCQSGGWAVQCRLDDMHDHYSQSAEKVLWERQLVSRAAGPPLCNPTLLSSLKPQIEKQTGSTVCWTGRASAAAEASRCRGRRQDGRGRLDTVGTPCHRVEQGRGGEGRVNKD